MTPDQARGVLTEAFKIDLVNLGRTMAALESGLTWNTFDNSKWRPNKNLALKDAKLLADQVESLVEALQVLQRTGA